MSIQIKVDTSKFTNAAINMKARKSIAVGRALYAAGAALLNDASFEPPKPPIKWGDLRGSASIQVYGDSAKFPQKGKNRGIDPGSKKGGSDVISPVAPDRTESVRVSYNTSYAQKLHDSPDWWPNEKAEAREPGKIGYKWLAIKAQKYAKKYQDVIMRVFYKELST